VNHLDGRVDPWSAPKVKRYSGMMTDTKLDIASIDDEIHLPCKVQTVKVAAATATRKRQGKGGCEGDTGRWVPAATRTMKITVCGDPTDELEPSFTFAPGNGVEWVYINDDCSMQGGGYRDVPNDGSIVSPR
jgi:hypothetical protein